MYLSNINRQITFTFHTINNKKPINNCNTLRKRQYTILLQFNDGTIAYEINQSRHILRHLFRISIKMFYPSNAPFDGKAPAGIDKINCETKSINDRYLQISQSNLNSRSN